MRQLIGIAVLGLSVLPAVAPAQTVETVRFEALLSSSKETGTVNGPGGMANAVVEFLLKKDSAGQLTSATADFRVQYDLGQSETLVAMHIHEAPEGTSGPVIIDSNFGAALSSGPGSGTLFRPNEITDPAKLAEIEEIIEYPGGYYVNIHTQSNPGGIMRGQLMPEDPALDAVKAVEAKVDALKADTAEIANLKDMIRKVGQVLGLRL